MPIRTRITDMLGIEHPVIMGGMTVPLGLPSACSSDRLTFRCACFFFRVWALLSLPRPCRTPEGSG